MNCIQSKLAKARIKSPGYCEQRRQEMIRLAWICEQRKRNYTGYHVNKVLWQEKENMFRKRAAWYVKKAAEMRSKHEDK